MQPYTLAIDIGASSGRHILGSLQQGRLVLEEVYRFENRQLRKNGHDCWDLDALWQGILEGLRACKALGKVPATVGIDTWAVDFVLLDAAGGLIGGLTYQKVPVRLLKAIFGAFLLYGGVRYLLW